MKSLFYAERIYVNFLLKCPQAIKLLIGTETFVNKGKEVKKGKKSFLFKI